MINVSDIRTYVKFFTLSCILNKEYPETCSKLYGGGGGVIMLWANKTPESFTVNFTVLGTKNVASLIISEMFTVQPNSKH